MRRIRMNIHGLHKHTDMYGYGCEVTDIHGYPDIIGFLPPDMVAYIVIYTGGGLPTSMVQFFEATGIGRNVRKAFLQHV
jgi:hypothetical protein